MVVRAFINKPCSQAKRENSQLLATLVILYFIIWSTKFSPDRDFFSSQSLILFNKRKLGEAQINTLSSKNGLALQYFLE